MQLHSVGSSTHSHCATHRASALQQGSRLTWRPPLAALIYRDRGRIRATVHYPQTSHGLGRGLRQLPSSVSNGTEQSKKRYCSRFVSATFRFLTVDMVQP